MQIMTSSADGTVSHQSVDVSAAATIGSILGAAEATIRTALIAAGFDESAANEIAIAAHEGGYAAAITEGLLPRLPGDSPVSTAGR